MCHVSPLTRRHRLAQMAAKRCDWMKTNFLNQFGTAGLKEAQMFFMNSIPFKLEAVDAVKLE